MEPIQLEAPSTPLAPSEDRRPKMEAPPPVRLIAVEDCTLCTVAGLERDLDEFYVGLLGFEREAEESEIVYRAENFRLRMTVFERPEPREDFRPLAVAVPSLTELMRRLDEAEIEFVRQRGLTPGIETLSVIDPAGNILEISEYRLAI
jgi:extradiol dioxygenase family protein